MKDKTIKRRLKVAFFRFNIFLSSKGCKNIGEMIQSLQIIHIY